MRIDELADQIVGMFNNLPDKPIEYQAIRPAEIAEATADRSNWGVFVLPYSTSREPLDRGDMCRRERTYNVYVNGPIKGQLTRELGCDLVEFLEDSFTESEFEDWTWGGDDSASLYDPKALLERKQFLSVFSVTYYRFA